MAAASTQSPASRAPGLRRELLQPRRFHPIGAFVGLIWPMFCGCCGPRCPYPHWKNHRPSRWVGRSGGRWRHRDDRDGMLQPRQRRGGRSAARGAALGVLAVKIASPLHRLWRRAGFRHSRSRLAGGDRSCPGRDSLIGTAHGSPMRRIHRVGRGPLRRSVPGSRAGAWRRSGGAKPAACA